MFLQELKKTGIPYLVVNLFLFFFGCEKGLSDIQLALLVPKLDLSTAIKVNGVILSRPYVCTFFFQSDSNFDKFKSITKEEVNKLHN